MQQPLADLLGHDLICSRLVGGQGSLVLGVAPNLINDCAPSAIAMRHRQQSIAQPIPDRNRAAIVFDIRTGTRRTTSSPRDQVQHYEGVPRP